MEFGYSKEQVLLREMYKKFAETEIKPLAEELDEEERFPVESIPKLARYGFMGIPFPKEYGGAGGNYLTYAMAVEELGKVCATTAVIVSAHTSLCAGPIYYFGTEEQKQKYLVPLAKGEKIGAFGLTEPSAGTDSSMQQTTAVLDGYEYVLNGTKVFITNAGYADIYVVIAMTDKSKGNKGISAFIVEKGTPGFSVGKKERKMGIRGSATCDLIFENCRIPKENLLGKVGQGFKIAMQTLDQARTWMGCVATGIAQRGINEAIAYGKERVQFGKPIIKNQALKFKVADMEIKTETARQMVAHALTKMDLGLPYTKESAIAKCYASDIAMEVASEAIQMFGGYGYSREYPVEKLLRDAKIFQIFEGTNEVQRIVISNSVIGK